MEKTDDDYKKSKFDHGCEVGAQKNAKFVYFLYNMILD